MLIALPSLPSPEGGGAPVDPFDLDKIKAAIRLDTDELDDFVRVCVDTAVARFHTVTGRSLLHARWMRHLDAFPSGPIQLMPDVAAVTAVRYLDELGEHVLAPESYRLIGRRQLVPLTCWPTWPVFEVRIEFQAGIYADGTEAPANVDYWIKAVVAGLLEHPQAVSDKQVYYAPHLDSLIAGLSLTVI